MFFSEVLACSLVPKINQVIFFPFFKAWHYAMSFANVWAVTQIQISIDNPGAKSVALAHLFSELHCSSSAALSVAFQEDSHSGSD